MNSYVTVQFDRSIPLLKIVQFLNSVDCKLTLGKDGTYYAGPRETWPKPTQKVASSNTPGNWYEYPTGE